MWFCPWQLPISKRCHACSFSGPSHRHLLPEEREQGLRLIVRRPVCLHCFIKAYAVKLLPKSLCLCLYINAVLSLGQRICLCSWKQLLQRLILVKVLVNYSWDWVFSLKWDIYITCKHTVMHARVRAHAHTHTHTWVWVTSRRRSEENVRAREWEGCCETLCSGHGVATALRTSLWLWLPAQDLHKIKSTRTANIPADRTTEVS